MQVGDNPASDMALAALGGGKWRGVLVTTGVYGATDATCGAIHVAAGVGGAVDFILQTAREEARAAEAAARRPTDGTPEGACSTPSCTCLGCTCGAACACGTPAARGAPGCDPCKDAKAQAAASGAAQAAT